MTIRQSLLALLAQRACYGNQLRAEFERRTGGSWPLNAGQVYSTLDRLERDGLVTKGAADDGGLALYTITTQGRAEAEEWLTGSVDRPLAARDELAIKLALALSLPGVDAASLIAAQRATTERQLADALGQTATSLARRLVLDGIAFDARAELQWLDHCVTLLAESTPYAIDPEPPRRGRPTRATPITTRL